ncbi:MAG: RtcB family protein [Phycisphaerales bacterium]
MNFDDEIFEHERDDRVKPNYDRGESYLDSLRADDRVRMWLADKLQPETGKALVRLQSLADLQRMAVMPDVHPSADVCVGTVIATTSVVYPSAIGGDIGCGMTTARLRDGVSWSREAGVRVLKRWKQAISIAVRHAGSNATTPCHAPSADELISPNLQRLARSTGERQIGTLGRGNHFVELQVDEQGGLWILVHSGSRAMGQAVLDDALRSGPVRATLPGLDAESEAGQRYRAQQEWCVRYAKANRCALLAVAAAETAVAFGATGWRNQGEIDWSTLIDLPHNFIRDEEHVGAKYIVHRKGAAPAIAGQLGVIPGSAGTMSVHVEGRSVPESLASSSHGAGRVLSRGDAKRSITMNSIRRAMKDVVYDETMTDQLRDESPDAYRDLRVVLEAQRDLVKVVRRLTPLVSFKAGG